MMPTRHYVRRLPRTLMFWLFILVVVLFGLRLVFPREGFDKLDTGEGPLDVAAADDGVWVLNHLEQSITLVDPADVGVMFTTADTYVVHIHRPLEEPLRSLVIASALSVDTALKQQGGGAF